MNVFECFLFIKKEKRKIRNQGKPKRGDRYMFILTLCRMVNRDNEASQVFYFNFKD